MDKIENNQKAKTELKNILYNTYMAFLTKFNNTQKAYDHTIFAIQNLLEKDTYHAFTRTNNLRHTLISTFPDPKDFSNILLDEFVDSMQQLTPQTQNQTHLYNAITITNHSRGKEQVIEALKKVIQKGDYTSFSRFYNGNSNKNYRKLLMESLSPQDINYLLSSILIHTTLMEKQCERINQQISSQHPNITNFQVNPNTFNQCREDILNGQQLAFTRKDYSFDNNLYASIDWGNKRKNQEDSVIILKHPQNPDFKILVVADGMGGLDSGEKASSYITQSITNWFEGLNPQYFAEQNLEALKQCFENEISNISKHLYHTYGGKTSSTFVGAIVAEKETIISHVGDSRAYVYSQGELHQLTEDDSISYDLWKKGAIQQKDDIRFYKKSNVVTKGMGFNEDTIPTTSTISNTNYDTLLLFSDGITDCLSDKDIMAITSNTPTRFLAKTLVDAAKSKNSVQHHLNPDKYNTYILAGKDNTTAAIYDNDNKKEVEEGR